VPDAVNRGEMPFLDHVEELRWRILYSLLAVLVGTIVGWVIVERVDVVGLLMRPIQPLLPGGRLKFTSPTEPFFITLKFAFALGVLLASPVVIYEAWAFLSPALYDRERRVIVPALSVGVLLFLAGAAAGYAWVLPRALGVLLSFQQSALEPIITANNYFGFAAQIIIAFGLVTELPLVIVILAMLGIVTPQFLVRNRRYALVISALAAALLSPPDAVSMLIMMVPLWLLYEVSIVCAWVVTRRRKRRTESGKSDANPRAPLIFLAMLLGVGGARAQGVPARADTAGRRGGGAGAGTPGGPGAPVQGQAIDTATARKLGLPTGPTRSFPANDPVMDSLQKLSGFRVTQYVADSLVVKGDSQTILLRGQAFVDRQGTKLEADSVRYVETGCRLDANGDPRLFESGTVMIGEGMRYDTCIKRGTVHEAFTDIRQGGVTWYTRGDLAVDSGATRVYGASSEITSDDQPVPDYHFATGELKWLNKTVMVARPAVLYVHDVPIMWLPFIFQDIRPGRRSGLLIPRFGLNDLVRPTRGYQRHFANLGYYASLSDYLDLLASTDWYSERNVTWRAQARYRWLNQFISGGFTYTHVDELDTPLTSTQIAWQHSQTFSSQTHLNLSLNYATSGSVLQRNSVDPFLATASLASQLNFDKRFQWGTLTLGGSRSQDLTTNLIQQTFPQFSLTPSPINITPSITWSPGFSFTNQQTFHSTAGSLPILGAAGIDSVALATDARQTNIGIQTPLRIGRWNWTNSLTVTDQTSNARTEVLRDSGRTHILYGSTFSTALDWQTGINLPQLFSGSWKLQPGIQIANATSAGPFMIRNQYSGGAFVAQGKRPEFTAGLTPTFFGFYPGFGPLARIRHSISPIISWSWAPSWHVPSAYTHALDPANLLLNSSSDAQQTISFGLSQNIEGKMKTNPKDTNAVARKFRILSINTDAISYNFEQAKKPGLNGWQTQTIGNTFASDLVPNFSLRIVHDLWAGPVGYDSAKFSPFLTNVNASFAITPATFRGLAHLFGFGGPPSTPATPPPAAQAAPGAAGLTPRPVGVATPPLFGGPTSNLAPPGLASGGGGFSMTVAYSYTRVRPTPGAPPASYAPQPGQQQVNLNMGFSPTAKWQVNWTTVYDLVTNQFGEQYIRLERDLHRWHASFAFVKSPNGNFAFTFYVNLLDQPEIKLNYEQQSVPTQ